MSIKETILLVSDNPTVRLFTLTALRRLGYRVIPLNLLQGLWPVIKVEHPDLLLLDLDSEAFDGFELLLNVKDLYPHLPTLVFAVRSADSIDKLHHSIRAALAESRRSTVAAKELCLC